MSDEKSDHLKPFRFAEGKSGNPGGRPRGLARQLREAIATLTHEFKAKGEDLKLTGETAIVHRLWTIMMTGSDKDAIAAMRLYYDRGYGLPTQKVTLEPPEDEHDDDDLGELSVEDLRILAKVRAVAPPPASGNGVH